MPLLALKFHVVSGNMLANSLSYSSSVLLQRNKGLNLFVISLAKIYFCFAHSSGLVTLLWSGLLKCLESAYIFTQACYYAKGK